VDHEAGEWWLSAGAIDGVSGPKQHAITEVAVYERGMEEAPGQTPLAQAVVTEVRPDRARLSLRPGGAVLDSSRQYRGVVTRLDRPALEVIVGSSSGNTTALGSIRAALTGHPLFAMVDQPGDAPVVFVEVDQQSARLVGSDGKELPNLQFPLSEAGVQALAGACAHLAKWHGLRNRTSAASPLNDTITVELLPVAPGEEMAPADRTPLQPTEGAIATKYANGQPPRMQVRLKNHSSKRAYAALLDLTDSFACVPLFADWLEPDGLGWVSGGKVQVLAIPRWKPASVDSVTDFLKVVAATSDFDAERWRQPPLLGVSNRAALDETLRGERDMGDSEPLTPAPEESLWGTSSVTLVTNRQ
jgi:hypothetical protein